MSYFHMRMHTIIGAKAFHGPVRNGKGWFHLAMVVRQRGLAVKDVLFTIHLLCSQMAYFGNGRDIVFESCSDRVCSDLIDAFAV